MINCFGLVTLPDSIEVKTYDVGKGKFLYFPVESWDPKDQQMHKYNAAMWVGNDEVDEWTKKLRPKAILDVRVSSLSTKKGNYTIKINKNYTRVLKNPTEK